MSDSYDEYSVYIEDVEKPENAGEYASWSERLVADDHVRLVADDYFSAIDQDRKLTVVVKKIETGEITRFDFTLSISLKFYTNGIIL